MVHAWRSGCITDCGYNVRRLNVDTGSNVDVMYEHCFRQLPAIIKSKMRAPTTVLSGFSSEFAWPLGRVTLQKFGEVPSTIHGMIKFPTNQGIATIWMEFRRALCVTLLKPLPKVEEHIQSESILVNPKYPDKRIKIGGNLSDDIKVQLRDILVANMDIFAWCEDDMTGVPRNIAEHKLHTNPDLTPVRQKKRSMAPERSEWLRLEVDKPVHVNILREVRYHTWVKNPILVKKGDGSWRMCVDFKDINKACPKDNYPLPEIDWKVESLSGFRFKCFLDAYKGYHQFQMVVADEDKTTFHTDQEAEKAFVEMKSLLRELPTLTAPIAGETLMLYLATSKESISSLLVADRGQVQIPLYFVSNDISGSEVNYPTIEKLVYPLVHTARRLRRYFQVHPIVVLTDQLIRQVLYKLEVEALVESTTIGCDENQVWELFTDGAFGPEGTGTGLVLTSPDREEHTYALRFIFTATNNESEYEALLSEMRIVQQLGIKHLDTYVDSQLVANQVNSSFGAHEASMQRYMELVHELSNEFDVFRLTQVPRGQNKKADTLRKLAALAFDHLHKNVWVEVLTEKSIYEKSIVAPIEEECPNWMTPLVKFLTAGELPADEKEARKVRMKAPIKSSKDMPVMSTARANKSIAATPNDTNNGNMAVQQVGHRHCRPYYCVIRFGIPNEIFSDTSTQFEGEPFKRWCQELNIKQYFTSVAHPQGIKACLGLYGNEWVDELSSVLWAYHTTHKNSTVETLFSVAYRTEAVIPVELMVPTKRIRSFDESSNDEGLLANLDMLEERREIASIQEVINKQQISKYYDKRVKPVSFRVGDYVWHNNEASRAENTGKLGPNWEGPYEVIGINVTGSYILAGLNGERIPCTWHATNLNRWYIQLSGCSTRD
ncbi:uncharacterized protein [Rutidosis leptorrhynchoides]|uniref:uncharacterized protein n=1 Tax=Rutidosis leptorrhynchoides TaxID=125765 RepID=UPI003A98DCE4